MITDGLWRSKDNDFREAVFYVVSPGPYGEKGEFSFAVLSAMETGKDKDLSRI